MDLSTQGAYTVSIDLTDAYWHLLIGQRFSPYLGFRLERRAYVFRAMPFGLNIAPRIFTKVIDTVVQQLREKELQVAAYLDDWLVWAPSARECTEATYRIVRFLQSLGLQINFKNSPRSSEDDPGVTTTATSSVVYCQKSFQDNSVVLSSSCNDSSYGRLIGQLGGHTPLKKVQGSWSQRFKQFHINILEAVAVFLSLKKLHLKNNIHIRLVLDSKGIVHCLNRQGSRSPQINHVMFAILSLAQRKRWHLSASRLHGVQNVMADSLSRTHPLETEYSLDKKSFSFVQELFPGLQVDLFMSLNKKLPSYVAPNMDPVTVAWMR
ncbi:uncharacterized protein [Palaemon carinicauda]|uniref:uncharacterized protein n=1 Tax=Palaemon carinicauda TaxID=392227 RepID=UPI0035B5BEEB